MTEMNKKITVVHIVDDLKIGGLERMLAMIALGLDKDRYDVSVWCLKGGGAFADELIRKGIDVRLFNFGTLPKRKAFMEVVRALKSEKPDITHSWALSGGVIGRAASILAGIKVRILHVQNVYNQTTWKDRFMDWALSFFTDRIIACAEAVKESLVKYMWIDPEKICVIYNSVDLTVFGKQYDKVKVRAELGIGSGDIVVGSASRLVPIKGQTYLLQAAAPIMKEDSRVKMIIVGDGPSRKALESEAGALGIGKRVIFTGIRTDMPRIMQAIDIFVLPSTIHEGLPLIAAEAHASSLPVIATDIGGNREIVINMQTGLLIPSKDVRALTVALRSLLSDNSKAVEMGRAGRKRCEKIFSTETMVKSVEAIYERCLR